jgi:hypothetical protein
LDALDLSDAKGDIRAGSLQNGSNYEALGKNLFTLFKCRALLGLLSFRDSLGA